MRVVAFGVVALLLVAAPPWGNTATVERLVSAGDSTASSCPKARYPRTGWGQVLGELLDNPVENRAISSRSTRSFTDGGHLASPGETLRSGDVFLIRFGHNDQKLAGPNRCAESTSTPPAGAGSARWASRVPLPTA